jgi:hypothetical protein
MSGLAFGPRPYQQETAIRADSHRLEGTMTKSRIPQAIAATAAAVTTWVLFSSVVSIAAEDQAAIAATRTVSTRLAAADEGTFKR